MKQEAKKEVCPCGKEADGFALSRKDNKTKLCTSCEQAEALQTVQAS